MQLHAQSEGQIVEQNKYFIFLENPQNQVHNGLKTIFLITFANATLNLQNILQKLDYLKFDLVYVRKPIHADYQDRVGSRNCGNLQKKFWWLSKNATLGIQISNLKVAYK